MPQYCTVRRTKGVSPKPPALTADDYSTDDRAELLALMADLAAELHQLLNTYAATGAESDDVLEQLSDADELLDKASRAISTARNGVRRIDGQARMRFLDRTIHRSPA